MRDRLRNSRGLKRTETGQRFLEGFEAVRHLRRRGRSASLGTVGQRNTRVRAVVAAILLGIVCADSLNIAAASANLRLRDS